MKNNKVKINEAGQYSKEGLSIKAKNSLDSTRSYILNKKSIDKSIVDDYITAYYDNASNDIFFSTNGISENEFVGDEKAELI